jgi:hypothetical protein
MDAQDRPGPSEVATCGHFVFGNGRWTVLWGECRQIEVSFTAREIRFHKTGGPEVLQIDEVDVRAPGTR